MPKSKAAPKGRFCFTAVSRSAARFAVAVDRDRRPRWRAHLHAMLYAAEVVSHIPIVGPRLTLDILATLNVLTIGPASAHVCANGRTCDGATGSGDVAAATT